MTSATMESVRNWAPLGMPLSTASIIVSLGSPWPTITNSPLVTAVVRLNASHVLNLPKIFVNFSHTCNGNNATK